MAVVVPSPADVGGLGGGFLDELGAHVLVWVVSSISSATVTPSLVTVGLPQPLSITALRPRGPKRAADGLRQFGDTFQQALAGLFVKAQEFRHSFSSVR